MKDAQPKAIYLKDYQEPNFWIDETFLHFDLFETHTDVFSTLKLRRNVDGDLVLHGQELELKSVTVNGVALTETQYQVDDESLTISDLPASKDGFYELACHTVIYPQNNTALEGLYKSSGMFCTQCEAEGFRKITYYLDRPDVMSVFKVRITADKQKYPVLLCNGNLGEAEDLADGRHMTGWNDPFLKPAYLFALVAGDLECLEDSFTTMSGRDVALKIYVEAKDLNKCDHAMDSLKRSMKWDEETFGREYDLDLFNIVAVDDFNMGAMENKSLNIFNTSCVLAEQQTTTDAGFQRVEAVVAHEYFHNWSGNRVTCRDWFQLSLKEGFTVFRDAEFSSDMGSRTVKRVEDVYVLRTAQFAEDAGPMAHPVRPDSFIEISNFYTVTIYEKGSEVVGMIRTLLGAEDFRKGSDLYFDRHDGQAVTCEDFVLAMEAASGKDLSQFRRWYSQAGTPVLDITGSYNADAQTYSLTIKQSCPATPGQPSKEPFHIPLAMGLLGEAGALRLQLQGEPLNAELSDNTHRVLDIAEAEQTVVFENIPEEPVPSLLRGFSAPVKLKFDYSREQLAFLMANDQDGFCRWDAAQQYGLMAIQDAQAGVNVVDEGLIQAYRSLLADDSLDPAMVALMLGLPSESYLAELQSPVDVHSIHQARHRVALQIAEALKQELLASYQNNIINSGYQPNGEQIAKRSLKNRCLGYLMLLESPEALALCVEQYSRADNMTDRLAALNFIVNSRFEQEKQTALASFYQQFSDESLVVNQWFQVQASCYLSGGVQRVKELMQHPAFDIKNPNKARSVIAAFAGANPVNFHALDGSGYAFLADQIIALDKLNPQIASRLCGPLSKWKKFVPGAQEKMRGELQRIVAEPKLSPDVYEVVSKSLD